MGAVERKQTEAKVAARPPVVKRGAGNSEKVVNLVFKERKKEAFVPALSTAEREELVLEFRLKARKLARSILRKWHARLDLQEVDSVVDLSLCEAVRRFDPAKGASFMTFLFYHLRGNLIRAVSAAANANAIPVEEENGEITRHSIYKGANAIEIAEALCSNDSVLPDEVLFKKQLVNLSEEACKKLDTLEQEVIERIFKKEQQLMDIANTLGYSRCHISRVKKKALDTLQEQLNLTLQAEGEAVRNLEAGMRRLKERRKIHRRRPRSRKAIESRELQLAEEQNIAAVG